MTQELKACPCHDRGEICAVPESKGGHDVMQNCGRFPCLVHVAVTPVIKLMPDKDDKGGE